MKSLYKKLNFDSKIEEEAATDEVTLLTEANTISRGQTRELSLQHLCRSTTTKVGALFVKCCHRSSWDQLKKSFSILAQHSLLAHLSLITAYTCIFVVVGYTSWRPPSSQNVIYTPAGSAIRKEAKLLFTKINETSNIYNRDPSPQVDEAWAALFHHANIRVSKEEIDRIGRSSIKLGDGSGDYFGTLDVYHQLHCLKYIREYIHQDYYTIKTTNVPSKEHVNHCIEMLRQVIMCKGDTALMTYEWLPDFPGPWPNFGIQHECVNWEKIDDWSKERSINIFDPKFLQHPKFGYSYAHLAGAPVSNHTGG